MYRVRCMPAVAHVLCSTDRRTHANSSSLNVYFYHVEIGKVRRCCQQLVDPQRCNHRNARESITRFQPKKQTADAACNISYPVFNSNNTLQINVNTILGTICQACLRYETSVTHLLAILTRIHSQKCLPYIDFFASKCLHKTYFLFQNRKCMFTSGGKQLAASVCQVTSYTRRSANEFSIPLNITYHSSISVWF